METVFKTVANSDGFDFVLSDATVDSYGDSIDPKGWDLSRFETNPIALWDHGHDPEIGRTPIGLWERVRVTGGKLVGTLKPQRGTHPKIDGIISLIENKVLRATSVGFQPKKQEPIDKNKPYGGQRYLEQLLLETSIVAIPANPATLALSKSLNLSPDLQALAFGEHADVTHRDLSTTGKQAATTSAESRRNPPAPRSKDTGMTTLAERITNAQDDLNAKRDKLVELTGADDLDNDAITEVTGQVDGLEKTLATLKAAEAKIGAGARAEQQPIIPAQVRKPLGHAEKDGMDLLVKSLVVRGIFEYGGTGKSLDQIRDERYPGHEALGAIIKADQVVGTTTGSHWADDLVQTAYFGFLDALTGYSIFPDLLRRGLSLTFDRWGTLTLPRRTAGGAGGGFVAEGAPIRVGKITTAAASLTPKKMGVIVAFTRELAKRSTPAIEAVVRQAILEDTAEILDPILLDATAVSAARPAGLLNGVSAVGTGFSGGDYTAVREDIKALLAPFVTASATSNIVVLMNPTQGLNLSLMEGPVGDPSWLTRITDRITFIESTHVTAGRLIAVRASDFAGAGGNPEFDVSDQATIHMEDTTPLEIVSGTGPTTADPVRSLWQTASVGIRMLMDVSWTMRRTGVVQWVDGTSW